MNLTHQYVQNQLQSGCKLSEAEQAAIDAHLAACPECRAYAAFDRQLSTMLPAAYPPIRHSEREIREKFNTVRTRMEKSHWTNRIFEHTLTLAGAGAALLVLVLVVSLLPHIINNQPAVGPAPAATARVTPTRTPTATTTLASPANPAISPTPGPTLLPDGFVRSPSPDGHWVALSKEGGLWIEHLGSSRTRAGRTSQWVYPGSWSPDSRFFLFWEGPQSASIAADGMPLFVVEVNTGKVVQLSKNTLTNPTYQSWAPDSSALAFTNGGGRSAQVGKWLSLYQVASQKVSDIILKETLIPGQVAWSPDGDTVAFAAVDAANTGAKYANNSSWDNPAITARRIYLYDPAKNTYRRLNAFEAYQDAPRWGQDGRLYYAQVEKDIARILVADPSAANSMGQELPGCQGKLPNPAGFYGQVDWSFLFNACKSGLQNAEMQAQGVVKSVARIKNTAYMGSGSRLLVVDVSNPAAPRLDAQSQDLPGTVAKVVVIPGDTQRVAASAGRYLEVFAAASTSGGAGNATGGAGSTSGELSLITQSKLPGPIAALIIDIGANRIYAGGALNSDASKGFVVVLDTTPTDRLDLLDTLQTSAPVRALALAKNTLYAALGSSQPGVYAILMKGSRFGAPALAIPDTRVYSMAAVGNWLFAGTDHLLIAYTLENVNQPQISWLMDWANTGTIFGASGALSAGKLPGPVLGFALRANSVYLAGLDAGGKVYVVSMPPATPVTGSSLVDTASFVSVEFAQMSVAGDRLELYQLKPDWSATLLGTYPPAGAQH